MAKRRCTPWEVCRSRRRYFWQCSSCVVHGRPAAGDSLRRVFCVYGAGGRRAGRKAAASHQQHAGHPLQRGTPQMVRRSFRGREDQLHRGNCLQLGQDSLQGEGFPQGGPLVGGRQLLEIPGGQGPAGGVLRQTACGRSIGTAGTGAGVRCQDQLVILPGQGIQQSALQPAEAPVPQLEKRLPDAACPGFPPSLLLSGPRTGRPFR